MIADYVDSVIELFFSSITSKFCRLGLVILASSFIRFIPPEIIDNNIKDKKESQNEVNVDQNSNSETIRLQREEFFKRNNNHSETNTIEKIKDNYNEYFNRSTKGDNDVQ